MWPAQALVSDVKAKVSEATGIAIPQQRLIFRGRVLRDANRITEHSLEDGACLHLVMAPQPQDPAQAQAQPQAPAIHLPPGGIPNIGAVRRGHCLSWLAGSRKSRCSGWGTAPRVLTGCARCCR